MNEIASVAIQSIVQEKAKHAPNAVAGVMGVAAAPDWLGLAIGLVSLATACAVFYKTYQDIKINNRKLSEED